MSDLLKKMNQSSNVYLGLNEPESEVLSKVHSIAEKDYVNRAAKLRETLQLTMVLVHPPTGCAFATNSVSGWIDGPIKKNPKCLTGGGDNFNAGFCNGLLNGYPPEQCVALGVCTSGYFVRTGIPPSKEQLIEFMNKWAKVDCGQID
eukprot:TRINITY_DN2168_c0_g1_i13.p2 TRINITY_DN2168_c0_g1~~TRINITY_DN2168_c0_g1_i13.p2  ORF type:complete len:147 (-),score=28.05 TRINITY_DN2168_c0_g1_i13:162-602(-)